MTRGLLWVFALAYPALAQSIFRVPVRVVAAPSAVTAPDGRFVHDLLAPDFQLFDNGRAQRFHLDYVDAPISVAVVIQANSAVRALLPQVRRMRSLVEALLIGQNGQASVITFADDVEMLADWTGSSGRLDSAFEAIRASGEKSRCLDAVMLAARNLEQAPAPFRRVIVLIAQPGEVGSSATVRDVLRELELANITVYTLAMPHFGKDVAGKAIRIGNTKNIFAGSDTGIVATADLAKLIPEIYRETSGAAGENAVSIISAETGGTRIPFRRLRELEAGVSKIGEELHTEYVLTYTPDHADPGYHRIRVELARSGLKVRARPGYYVPE